MLPFAAVQGKVILSNSSFVIQGGFLQRGQNICRNFIRRFPVVVQNLCEVSQP